MLTSVTTLFVLSCCVLGFLVESTSSMTCDGTVVTNNTVGVIRDHSGGGKYTRPTHCIWIITSPSGQENNKITLVFNYFNTIKKIDYLNIKDGNSSSAPDLVWLYGNLNNTPAVISSGNALYLEWQVRRTYPDNPPTGRGFEAHYSSSSCPSGCNWKNNQGYCFNSECLCSGGWRGVACDIAYCDDDNDCGGSSIGKCKNDRCRCSSGFYGGDCLSPICDSMTVLTDTSVKNFSSRHQYFERSNMALHATNCSWLIKPDGATRIELQFSDFNLDEDEDFVEIYDGDSIDAPLARRFTGSMMPPKFVSSGGAVFIHYYAAIGVDHGGFTASYVAVGASDDDNSEDDDSSGSHNALFMAIGVFIGVVVTLVAVLAYSKWKQRQQSGSQNVESFHAFNEETGDQQS